MEHVLSGGNSPSLEYIWSTDSGKGNIMFNHINYGVWKSEFQT
ncbi:MAG: hypothetical protein V3U92_01680 [Cellulophaga sp.]